MISSSFGPSSSGTVIENWPDASTTVMTSPTLMTVSAGACPTMSTCGLLTTASSAGDVIVTFSGPESKTRGAASLGNVVGAAVDGALCAAVGSAVGATVPLPQALSQSGRTSSHMQVRSTRMPLV